MPDEPAENADLLDSRYRLDSALCQTGLGLLFRAEQLSAEPCSICLLPWTAQLQQPVRERCQQEIMRVRALGPVPHLAKLRDLGHSADGILYLELEPLEGQTLARRLERTPRMDLATAVALLAQAGAALEVLHQQGVVHGCLNAAGLLLCPASGAAEQLVLLDLGCGGVLAEQPELAELEHVRSYQPHAAGQAAGTPRADIHAMGAILLQMLTGRLPGPGPRPTQGRLAELDRDVAAVVRQALAADPEEGFHTMGELMQALQALVQRQYPGHAPRRARTEVLLAGDAAGKADTEDTEAGRVTEVQRVAGVQRVAEVGRVTEVQREPGGLEVDPSDQTVLEPVDADRTSVKVDRLGPDRDPYQGPWTMEQDLPLQQLFRDDTGVYHRSATKPPPPDRLAESPPQAEPGPAAGVPHDAAETPPATTVPTPERVDHAAPTVLQRTDASPADTSPRASGSTPVHGAPARKRSRTPLLLMGLLVLAGAATLAVAVANTGLPGEHAGGAGDLAHQPPTPRRAASLSPPRRRVEVEALLTPDLAAPRGDAAVPSPPDAAPPPDTVPRADAGAASARRPDARRGIRPTPRSRRSAGRSRRPRPRRPASTGGRAWLTVVTRSGSRELWANIYLDGKTIGRSLLYRRVVPAGSHLIVAKKAGYRSARKKIILRRGQEMRVILQLTRDQ